MDSITDKHTNRYTFEKNTKLGKNATFYIHVKSEPGYSPKHPGHVFSVIGFNMPCHGLDHKLQQITICEGRDSRIVAICDRRNSWRFKIQLFRLMSIEPEGILLIAENKFTSTPNLIKKDSWVHWLWAKKLIYLLTNRYTSEVTPKQKGVNWSDPSWINWSKKFSSTRVHGSKGVQQWSQWG